MFLLKLVLVGVSYGNTTYYERKGVYRNAQQDAQSAFEVGWLVLTAP